MLRLASIILVVFLSGCASSGPSVRDIFNAKLPNSDQTIPVVDFKNVPAEVTNAVSRGSGGGNLSRFNSAGVVNERLRRGDVIEVTIFDTGEEGLFSSTESKSLDLGRFTVDQNGFVSLPFVGRMEALNTSPENLQNRIVEGLRGSAVNPQVVVRVVEKPTNTVTVNGAVNSAGRFPLTESRERILDVIALAGGPASAPGATTVTLVRGSSRGSAPLDRILADDSQNVYLQPDDQIYVEANAASFTAMGGFKSTGEFEFEASELTLAEAIGRTGGVSSNGGDARNVYLFRNQPLSGAAVPQGALTPVIYHIDMSNAANFAYMQQFRMQDGDVLYAAGR